MENSKLFSDFVTKTHPDPDQLYTKTVDQAQSDLGQLLVDYANPFIKALEGILKDEFSGCPVCDNGLLRSSAIKRGVDHWDDCAWNNAKKLLEQFKQEKP